MWFKKRTRKFAALIFSSIRSKLTIYLTHAVLCAASFKGIIISLGSFLHEYSNFKTDHLPVY